MKDVFKRLKKDLTKFPWGAIASVMTEQLQAQGGVAADVLAQLQEWAAHLLPNALMLWSETVIQNAPCDCPETSSGTPKKCRATAVVSCDVCSRKSCLAHARVDYMGGAICEICIGEAKARARAKRPSETASDVKDVTKALKILGLDRAATWDEVRARYKKLVVEHNADRPQSDRARIRNTERLKKINWAFGVLRRHYEDKNKEAA